MSVRRGRRGAANCVEHERLPPPPPLLPPPLPSPRIRIIRDKHRPPPRTPAAAASRRRRPPPPPPAQSLLKWALSSVETVLAWFRVGTFKRVRVYAWRTSSSSSTMSLATSGRTCSSNTSSRSVAVACAHPR